MRAVQGAVVEWEAAWPAYARVRLTVPDLGAVGPGQALLAKPMSARDPLLARVMMPSLQDPGSQVVECLAREENLRGNGAAAGWHAGDRLAVVGPVGRSFQVEHRTRRALLVGGGPGISALLLLTRGLMRHGAETTFLSWPDSDGAIMPGSELPPEVEYVVAPPDQTALPQQLEALATWADQLFLAVAPGALPWVLDVLRRRLLRLRRGFAQALLATELLPCGVGACDLCTIPVRDGYRRLCRDGLVFDLLSLV
jgi:dihydroorotate dehydrogenase electron transfer subunit